MHDVTRHLVCVDEGDVCHEQSADRRVYDTSANSDSISLPAAPSGLLAFILSPLLSPAM